jgi:hypothetical protein
VGQPRRARLDGLRFHDSAICLRGEKLCVLLLLIFRPFGASSFPAYHPRLAPRAVFFRRLAAGECRLF